MRSCLIGLGSNQGESALMFQEAAGKLAATPGVALRAASSLYVSRPAGGPPDQREFLNAALLLDTDLPSGKLLDVLLGIEAQLGRNRTVRWGPRTLDLDLLLAGDEVIDTPRLTLPHPRLMVRQFAVIPAAEIAPVLVVPRLEWNLAQLGDRLSLSDPLALLVAADPAWLEKLPQAVQAQISGWSIASAALAALDRDAIEAAQPRFIVYLGAKPPDDFYAKVRALAPWVVVPPADLDPLAAEVVAHCAASATILEESAGPNWLPS